MATTTTTCGGTDTSFSNTPQAKDDIFTTGVIGTGSATITENLLGVVYLNVMSNDLGGNAKTLWSLDNATSLSTATKVYAPADLLVQDTSRIEATSTDTSLNGAKIWITSDGKVGYDAATLSTTFKAQLQALAAGGSLTDSFTYAIRLGNGTLSWATAQVQFAGVNDSVTMSLGAQAGTVTEDATTTPSTTDSLSTTGTIAFNDVDLSDTHTASFAAAGGNTTALGNFALASVIEAANAANGTVNWTYTVNNAAAQYLAQGQTAIETYVVTVNDGHGSSTTKSVTITITGTNDQVHITSGVQAGDAKEDSGDYAANGSITFTDADLIDTHSVTVTPGASGYLGSFTTDPLHDSTGTGSGSLGWHFAVDNAALQFLGEGQTLTQTYNVAIGDGTVQTVTITITGTNDQVQITSGVQAGNVEEDSGHYAASGSITFTDVDLIDTHSVSVTPGASGYLGSFTTNPLSDSTGTGSGSLGWNFAVNNTALQFLGEGQTRIQTYNAAIGDGTVQTVTITITGTNDQVQITSGVQAGDAKEDSGDYAASGSITFTDVDLIDTHSVSVTPGASGYLGSFTTNPLSDSTGTGSGSLGWNFAVNNTALQFLGEGQTRIQTYNVAIGDGTVQTVTITITGTNDQVQITSGVQAGDAKEDSGDYAASGSITFTDVDLIDTHSVSVTPGASGYLGSFTTNPLSDSTGTGSGSLGWNFAVNNTALQFLGEGQTRIQTYNVAIGDGAVQTVTITITGTNDRPTLTIADSTGAMNEGNGTATLSDSGALSFTDLDSTDTVTVSQTANNDIAWSGGTLNAGVASALVAGFSVDQDSWDYSSSQNLDFLSAGETITFSYAVVATDDSGAANAASATQTVSITITGSNDAPVLSFVTGNDVGAVQEDTSLSVSGQFSSTDIDHAATATWTINGSPTGTYGSIAVDSSGQWTYTLANGSDGIASAVQSLKAGESHDEVFSVQVSDGLGGVKTQLVTVTVSGSNDAPVLSFATGNEAGAVQEDTTLSVSGQFSSTDIDHDATASWSINGSPTGIYGSIAVDSTGQWTYTLANGSDGIASAVQSLKAGESHDEVFSVQVSDGLGGVDTQLVTVTVTGSNDAPVLSFVTGNDVGAVQEDTSLSVSGQFSSADIDHDATATWSIAGTNTGAFGSIAVDSSGQWTYTLANGSDGIASAVQSLKAGESHDEVFSVQVSDGLGGVDTQLVTVTVTGSNDAPVLSFATGNDVGVVQEDTTFSVSGQFSSADIDHDATASWSINGSPTGTYGSIAVDSTGQWTYTLANGSDGIASVVQSLKAGESHDEVFSVQVSDGLGGVKTQLVTVTVSGSNDAPVLSFATGNEAGAVQEDTTLSVSGQFSSTDIDHAATATWSIAGTNTGAFGSIAVDSSGQWTYTLANGSDGIASAVQSLKAGESHDEVFSVQVSDGLGGVNTQLVTVTVSGSNDAPVLSFATGNEAGAVQEDTTLSVSGQFSSTDIDHDATASWSINGSPTGIYGSIAVDSTGQWTYTLANGSDGVASAVQSLKAGESHDEVFSVQVSDGLGGVDTQLVTITVSGSNDAPVLSFATGNNTGAVQEDSSLSVSGQFSSADIDHDATATWSIAGSNTGSYGSIAVDSSGQWTYTLANGSDGIASAVQSLKAGESHDEVFSVQVSDGLGGVDTQLVTVTVSGSNDAPVLSFASGNDVGAVQEDTSLSVSGQFSSTDIDHDATATWSIAGTNTGAYGSIAVDGTGQWTYTLANDSDGIASAVQSLKAGESHDEVFSVQVSDGLGSVDTQLVTITVTGSNDAPVLSFVSGNEAGAVQEDTSLSVSGQFNSTDIDHAATATWSIAGTNTGSYGSIAVDSSGQWTYTLANGTDGVASAVQSLKAGESHDEVFSVQVSDGLGGVDTQLVTVTVTGSNDAPVLSFATGNDVGVVQEDTTFSVSGQFSSADIDHDATATWSINGSATGSYGSIAVDSTGQWTYTLANGSDGIASAVQSLKAGESHDEVFSVQVSDGLGGVDTQLVTVTVSGSNDAPVLSFASGNDVGAVQEDSSLSVSGQFSSADIDHAATASWSINGSATGSYGSIAVDSTGQWTYTLANGTDGVASAVQSLKAGESHDEVFSVQVSDGLGGVDTQLVTVTVTGSNDAPVLSFVSGNDVGAVQEDTSLSVSGQFSSTDIDHDATATWSIAGSNTGSYGSIAVDSSGQWTYTLANGTDGVASAVQSLKAGESHDEVFSVQVSDGLGGVDTHLVTITVTGSNDAPVLSFATGNDVGVVQEDSTLSVSGQFSSTDIDHDATASWSIAGSNTGTYGSIAVDSSGQWTYTLANGSDGIASAVQSLKAGESHDEVFSVQVSDGLGGVDTHLVTITVTGSNDAPVLSFATGNDVGAVQEDSTLSVSGQFSSADIDHDATATWSIAGSNTGSYGSIAVDSSGQWTYTLANGTDGVASAVQSLKAGESHDEVFSVQVSDGLGGVDTHLVTITVTGSNDAPVLSFATGNDVGVVQEDSTLSVSGQFSSTDIDHDATASWSIAGSNTGTYGSIAVDSSGQWTYTLANGSDGIASAVQSLKAGESHDEVFSVQVSDGLGGVDTHLVTITVTGSNDAPVLSFATGNDVGAVQEDSTLSVSGQFSSADIDHDATATWSIAGSNTGSYGSIAVDSSGQWTYTLANGTDGVASAVQSLKAGESHDEVFSVQVSDGLGGVDTHLVTITVTGSNDAPVLSFATGNDAGNVQEDTSLSISGQFNSTDIDHDATASWSINGSPTGTYGSITVDSSGQWTYTLANGSDGIASAVQSLKAGESHDEVFSVQISDGLGGMDTQLVTITVTGSNDAPVLSFASGNDVGAVQEDTSLSVSGQFSSTDIDHDATATWSIAGSNTGSYGSIAVDSSGQWTYTLANGSDGIASAVQSLKAGESHDEVFSVQVSDGLGGVDTQLVTVTVSGSNDAPVLSFATGNDVGAVQEDSTLSVSGQFSSADIDHDATATWSINGSATGSYGSIAVDSTGQWTYTLANGSDGVASAVQSLKAGESHDEVFSVQVSDGLGGVDTQLVTVTVTGSNDAAVLSSASVTLTETNAPLTTGGSLTVSDIDSPESFQAQSGTTSANGIFAIDTTGNWSYTANSAFDALNVGDSLADTFAVFSADGTETSVSVTINGTNDAPVTDLNGGGAGNDATAAFTEQTSVLIAPSATITDIDSANLTSMTATLTVRPDGNASESLSLNASATTAAAGLTVSYTTGTGVLSITGSATKATYQTILDGILYNNSSDTPTTSDRTVNVLVSDGIDSSISHSVTIGITALNDTPVNTLPASYTTNEDTAFKLSGLSVADVDAGAGSISVTLTVGSGSLTAATAGSVTVSGSGTSSIVLTGTLANINTYLATVANQPTYTPVANANGTVTLTMLTNDGGNTGTGGALSDSDTININITALNDTPVNTLPASYTTNEDTAFKLSGLSVADVDAGAGSISVTLTVGSGSLTAATAGSVTVSGSGTSSIVLTGTLANINTYLATVANQPTYTPAANANGTVTLTMLTNDGGNTGTGGALSDSDTININITALNDTPVNTLPASYTTNEDTAFKLSGLSVADVDAGAGSISVTLTVGSGSLTAATAGSVTVSGSGTSSIVLTGTLANINTYLATVANQPTYTPVANANGTVTLTMLTNDGGNTGTGGALSDSDTININITAVNDAPVLSGTVPTSVNVSSGVLVSSFLSSTDVDSGALKGIAITAATRTNGSNGKWQYSTDSGSTWTDVGTVSTSSALLLRSGDLVRMTGNGNAGNLTYKAWDQTSGTFATKVDPGSGGGTSAFSTTSVIWSVTHPAGIAGEPINLALANPSADHSLPVTVTITGVPADWIVNGATHLGDGSWSVTTIDPSVLTVTTTASYVGAMVLLVTETWTNTDGTTGSAIVSNNVEAYAPGSPIFALSLNDNLTGSSGADTFVFAQPIGNNQIYNFDAAADKIDLIGFTGVTGFADLSITNDANGNALVSIGTGQTITLKGVDAANLSEANFQFDVDPLTNNTGTLTIADGAIMPFGGSIHNSGTIELGSAGSTTSLEILFRGATLSGGGQVLLSDNSQNVIFGGSADTVLTNIDNRISGAGQLGAGQMVLINAGLIMASGLNSLVLDTGTHTITNSGVLESTGPGGMTVASTVENTGHLWANGGDLRLLADVTGDGSATIDGDATLTFSGAAHGSVAFHGEGAGTLVIAQAETAGSLVGILGLESNDLLMFGDLAFGANTQLSYNANASGAGGLLTVDDGAHRAEVNLLGHYTVEDFQVTDDGQAGTQVSYHGESSGTLVGSMLADTISGGDGNDIIVGRGGEDTLSGGAGADVFAYLNVNEGGDHILDYNFAEGDTIDLSALLKANFVSGTSQVSDFVQVVQTGSDLTVKVDTDGASSGKNFVDVAVLDHTGTPGPDLVRTWFGDADHTLTA
ncbi:VCBS domain-containing protein [Pseudomonas sp. B21-015]|uniref:VCBS domain-containing protein n=1 Tax=Pseudomonas sp. B21-015 TaxID=2895473 RepID=UPI00215E1768|nr:VCBS domain-containing protein [Pseudomonas sp. B21-015]UVM51926.1 VCBS domain-containing protein [Pseudomonas sp. B21-015]